MAHGNTFPDAAIAPIVKAAITSAASHYFYRWHTNAEFFGEVVMPDADDFAAETERCIRDVPQDHEVALFAETFADELEHNGPPLARR